MRLSSSGLAVASLCLLFARGEAATAPRPAARTAAAPGAQACASAPLDIAPAHVSSRRAALQAALFVPLAAAWPLSASAKYAAGSKEEKAYNDCLGICVYYCTKPKGTSTKSRTECFGECKPLCKADPKTKFDGAE